MSLLTLLGYVLCGVGGGLAVYFADGDIIAVVPVVIAELGVIFISQNKKDICT